ncbi:hypothetical protein OHS70_38905 (plasmid) [Streptomyces sp. NBC_00390]|uniref:hypothetical protein n=1 Tax=Streptomyces sp. NBC_00390 TaxID=2975736 RepID=UPI002E1FE5A6
MKAAEWCDTSSLGARASRFEECDLRRVPVRFGKDGETQAETFFYFLRKIYLNDGDASFTERLTVLPAEEIPADFARIDLKLAEHLCQDPCTPNEPEHGSWTSTPSWTPGDMHSASLYTTFTWDASVADKEYRFQPDIKIDADIYAADGQTRPILTGYQWSKDYWEDTPDLDQIRCDTKITNVSAGCVFVNSAPTYIFNGKKYPQAAAHAWLIQTMAPNHPGSKGYSKPLYYMGNKAQNDRNRGRMCPTGWAAANGDASALVDASDALNCDEFAFASTYNSGGMAKSEGGLNPALPVPPTTQTPNGKFCVQTFAKQYNSAMHLYNIDGTYAEFGDPTNAPVCGRSAMSGIHNQESMGNRFATFMKDMRIMDKDAYWLDTRMTTRAAPTRARPVARPRPSSAR